MEYCQKKIEMFLNTIDWNVRQFKSFVLQLFEAYIDKISRINYKKYDEKWYDQWYISILLNMYNYCFWWDEEL